MADLEKVIADLIEGINFAEQRGYGGLAETMKAALPLLKEQEPKWISVKDRSPEEGVLVLVAFDVDLGLGETRQVDTAMRQEGVFCGGGLDNYLAFPCEVDVTHWMPLPEPPKEET